MPENSLPDLEWRLRHAADAMTVLDQPVAAPGIRRRADRRQRVQLLGAAAGVAAVLALGLGLAGPMNDRGLAPADGGSTSIPVTPEPTVPVTPEPTVPVTPDPTVPVTPEPSAPVTPDPTLPVTPDPTAPVTPEPSIPVTPDPPAVTP